MTSGMLAPTPALATRGSGSTAGAVAAPCDDDAAGAAVTAAAANVLMAAGSGSFESVVTIELLSTKYFRAAVWRSAGVSDSIVR